MTPIKKNVPGACGVWCGPVVLGVILAIAYPGSATALEEVIVSTPDLP